MGSFNPKEQIFDPIIRPEDSTHSPGQSLPFQRWFKFKEAFSPQLVNGIIEALPNRPKVVLDCFGGSGTTSLFCQMAGIESVAVEVNPLLQDLIEAKLTAAKPNQFINSYRRVVRRAKQLPIDLTEFCRRLPETFVEPGVKGRFLFYKDAAVAIEQIRCAIAREESDIDRRLLIIALASILIDCSNVRVDGKGRRYRQGWQQRRIGVQDIYEAFHRKATQIGEDIASATSIRRAAYQLIRGDARKMLSTIAPEIDLALFSPPYPNSFDYTDIYNVELWMLGYLDSRTANRELRLSTMRSHVQVRWSPAADAPTGSRTLTKTLNSLNEIRNQLWDSHIPEMVLGYFQDFRGILQTLKTKVSVRAPLAMVVGNSQYGGVVIDTPKILTEIGKTLGLHLMHEARLRSMRTSHQQARRGGLMESLLVLKA